MNNIIKASSLSWIHFSNAEPLLNWGQAYDLDLDATGNSGLLLSQAFIMTTVSSSLSQPGTSLSTTPDGTSSALVEYTRFFHEHNGAFLAFTLFQPPHTKSTAHQRTVHIKRQPLSQISQLMRGFTVQTFSCQFSLPVSCVMSCSCGAVAEIWPDLTNEGYERKHDIIFLIIKLRGPKIQGITPFLFLSKWQT